METLHQDCAGLDVHQKTGGPRFGQIKHVLGVRRFLRRGLAAMRTEWSLVCTAANVGILLRHWQSLAPHL